VHTVTQFLLHTQPLLIYFIVAVILLLESAGVPILNSSLLLFTGALASFGHLNIWILASTAIVGSVAGACLAYTVGARGGSSLLLQIIRFFHIEEQKVDTVERWFQKLGLWMIFFSRITPYIRPFACFSAGFTHANFVHFLFAATVGSIIWCSTLLAIGWNLGRRWVLAVRLMQDYTLPMLAGLAIVIVLYIVVTRKMKTLL